MYNIDKPVCLICLFPIYRHIPVCVQSVSLQAPTPCDSLERRALTCCAGDLNLERLFDRLFIFINDS